MPLCFLLVNRISFGELMGALLLLATELVVVTGASSGLGRKTCQALLRTGEYHVVGAVREYVL